LEAEDANRLGAASSDWRNLILDKAHRGMKKGGRPNGDGKPTIVRQLINGSGAVPGIPIVWGISATVQRFNDAITGMQDRGTFGRTRIIGWLVSSTSP
jgi:hypothetical protein